MARRSLPTTDTGLLAWSLNFKTLITADPVAYGLTPALAAEYAALDEAYAAALAASERTIRSMTTTVFKNEARTRLRNRARLLINLVAGTVGVTDAQKVELGLALRGAGSRAPIPAGAPGIDVLGVSAWQVHIRLGHKPASVIGAMVFSYVSKAGEDPPADMGRWKLETLTGRKRIDITFPSSVAAGTQVWLAARWFNNRKQAGPLSNLKPVTLQGRAMQVTPGLAAA